MLDHYKNTWVHAKENRKAVTPSERIIWKHIQKSDGLPKLGAKFSRQVPILFFVVDFLCRERQLIVEIDGVIHDTTEQYDMYRDTELKRLGLTTLRLKADYVINDTDSALLDIQKQLNRVISFEDLTNFHTFRYKHLVPKESEYNPVSRKKIGSRTDLRNRMRSWSE